MQTNIYLSAKNYAKLSTISFHHLNAIGNLAKDHQGFAVHLVSKTITHHHYVYHLFRKGCDEKTLLAFQSGTILYSIHVTEGITCTFCEIVSTKIHVYTMSAIVIAAN